MESMRMGILATGLVLLAGPFGVRAAPKDLAADMVMLENGRTMGTSKIYISGTRSRMESSTMMGGFTSIVRRDRGVIWTLFPERRQYSERPLDAKTAMHDPTVDPPGMISKERTGSDSVGGHACTVYRYRVAGPGGQQITTTGCYSGELGLTVRSEVSGIVSELRNIRTGAQPASLFEIPAGYQLTTSAVPRNVKLPSNMPPELAAKMRQAMEQRGRGSAVPPVAGDDPGAKGTLPSWLPAMPGCTPRSSGTSHSGGAGLICQAPPQETALWYEAALKRGGFSVQKKSHNSGRVNMVVLTAVRGGLEVSGNFAVNARGENAAGFTWWTK